MEKNNEENIIILIDIKSVILYSLNENFNDSLSQGLKIIKKKFNLNTKNNQSITELQKKYKNSKEEMSVKNILDLFFKNLEEKTTQKICDFIKNNTIFKFEKNNKYEKLFYEKIDNLNNNDISELKQISNLKLILCENEISKFEKKIIEIIFPENKTEIIYLGENLNLIKKEKTYIISKRPEFINNFLSKKKINFDFKNFFIYFDNLWLNEKRDFFDLQANKFSIKWDLLILKNLKNKIKIIEDIKNKKIEEKNLLKIGINFSTKILYKEKVRNFINDFFPLIFVPYDCTSKRDNDDFNVIMAKITESLIFRGIRDYDSINEKCEEIKNTLISWENKYNRKILFSNTIKNYCVYYDRFHCYNFFNKILENEDFKKKLDKSFPGVKIKYPKTIYSKNLNYAQIQSQITEKNLSYPLITKTNIAPRIINKYSHEMIIIKNPSALKKLLKTQPFEIK